MAPEGLGKQWVSARGKANVANAKQSVVAETIVIWWSRFWFQRQQLEDVPLHHYNCKFLCHSIYTYSISSVYIVPHLINFFEAAVPKIYKKAQFLKLHVLLHNTRDNTHTFLPVSSYHQAQEFDFSLYHRKNQLHHFHFKLVD